jgi:hypothetical protein
LLVLRRPVALVAPLCGRWSDPDLIFVRRRVIRQPRWRNAADYLGFETMMAGCSVLPVRMARFLRMARFQCDAVAKGNGDPAWGEPDNSHCQRSSTRFRSWTMMSDDWTRQARQNLQRYLEELQASRRAMPPGRRAHATDQMIIVVNRRIAELDAILQPATGRDE